ncbi:MAG: hypothetical protein PVH61_19740 [Candidatus Aminicenantes bacterium]|jgi:hypothetical protein
MDEMVVTPGIREAHQAFSDINLRFLEYVQNHPEWLDCNQFSKLVQWSDSTVIGTLQPWPLFISTRVNREFARASVSVFELIKAIPNRIFSFDPAAMSRYYQLPVEHLRHCLYGLTDKHITDFLGRGDFIFTPTGLQCIEYNVTSSLGGMQSPFWEPMYLQTPIFAQLIEDLQLKITLNNVIANLIQHLAEVNRKWYPDEDDINIAFVIHDLKTLALMSISGQAKKIDQMYADTLKQKHGSLKGKVSFCLFEELIIKGDYLYYKDKRIHAVLDNFRAEIPIQFLEILKKENVLIYNGAMSRVLSAKLNISLLSEHEHSELFTREERKIIKKYIPWTRKMVPGRTTYNGESVNLEHMVISRQDDLVLKPSQGYGGKGIHVGRYTTGNQWQEVVRQAFHEGNWIVQQRIEIQPLLFQWGEHGCARHESVWGFYVFGTSFGGIWLRVLPSQISEGLVNAHKGAKMPIVIETDE